MKTLAGGPGSRLGMPLARWPEGDRKLWIAAFAHNGLLDQPDLAANMAVRSKLTVETCYARWLLFLTARYPDSLAEPPASRAIEAVVVEYLHGLALELSSQSVLNYACRLRNALEILAPDTDFSWFAAIINRADIFISRQPRQPKPFVETGLLYAHGIQMIEAAMADMAACPVTTAERFRNGLAFALLAARPLRRDNFIKLELGDHFIETEAGYSIKLEKTKTSAFLEFAVPEELTLHMQCYLLEHRPVLLAGGGAAVFGSSYLWLARSGAAWPSDTFADMITRHAMLRFNKRMTPHDFRHAAATTIMMHEPEMSGIIRVILGHSTSRTAERHYIHAKGTEAGHAYQSVIRDYRQAAADYLEDW